MSALGLKLKIHVTQLQPVETQWALLIVFAKKNTLQEMMLANVKVGMEVHTHRPTYHLHMHSIQTIHLIFSH